MENYAPPTAAANFIGGPKTCLACNWQNFPWLERRNRIESPTLSPTWLWHQYALHRTWNATWAEPRWSLCSLAATWESGIIAINWYNERGPLDEDASSRLWCVDPPPYLKQAMQNSGKVKASTTMQLNTMELPYTIQWITICTCILSGINWANIAKAIKSYAAIRANPSWSIDEYEYVTVHLDILILSSDKLWL